MIDKLLIGKAGIKLDIGCGSNLQPGFVGLDKRDLPGVVQHDLESIPWPLPDNCANTILASHILEHLDPRKFLDIMAEIHRVAMDGCQVMIAVPYAGSYGAYQDPTHMRPGYNEATWAYFDPRDINDKPNGLYKIYEPPPLFQERVVFDVGTNMEAVLCVWKDPAKLKELMGGKGIYVKKVRRS